MYIINASIYRMISRASEQRVNILYWFIIIMQTKISGTVNSSVYIMKFVKFFSG